MRKIITLLILLLVLPAFAFANYTDGDDIVSTSGDGSCKLSLSPNVDLTYAVGADSRGNANASYGLGTFHKKGAMQYGCSSHDNGVYQQEAAKDNNGKVTATAALDVTADEDMEATSKGWTAVGGKKIVASGGE